MAPEAIKIILKHQRRAYQKKIAMEVSMVVKDPQMISKTSKIIKIWVYNSRRQ